jgi:hypothetical protein
MAMVAASIQVNVTNIIPLSDIMGNHIVNALAFPLPPHLPLHSISAPGNHSTASGTDDDSSTSTTDVNGLIHICH